MAIDGSFIVSPYLQEITPESIPHFLSGLTEPGERADLAGFHARGGLALVYDFLNLRLFALSPADLTWLGALKAERGVYRPGDDGGSRGARERLVADEMLLPVDDVYRRHRYQSVELEINRHCNLRCVFCPVSLRPKPKAFMSDATFALVLERVREYGAPQISLNHYSEPGLDRALVEKITRAAEHGLGVVLNTNLSLLDEEKIAGLKRAGNVIRIIVNLPSVDRVEYERATGTKVFDKVIRNVRLLHRYGLPTRLAVNAPRETADTRLKAVNDEFAEMFGATFIEPTDSRAGALEREDYAPLLRHPGRLNGCSISIWQVNVSHEGKAFLCCQDYEQDYVLGDLRTHTLRELAENDLAVAWRKTTFGGDAPTASFLCTKCAWTRPVSKDGPSLQVGDPGKGVLYNDAPLPTRVSRSGTLAAGTARD